MDIRQMKLAGNWLAQVWQEGKLVSQVGGTDAVPSLSYDAAREIASALPISKEWTGRIMSRDCDYCEIYSPGNLSPLRTGSFAETVLVHFT